MIRIDELNAMPPDDFVALLGGVFENSPWIARRTAARRPFATISELHAAMCDEVSAAAVEAKLSLVQAHPDLVGRLAREGRLNAESTREQAAAGLTALSEEEVESFERYNAAYREKFGFPFVICARENRKETILAAFPMRLNNSREQEVHTALAEIYKIARLRLRDLIQEKA
jgi:2-oxo-4-hydroxy-4-carboxy-5-ureidoimidazoline decarboxylase